MNARTQNHRRSIRLRGFDYSLPSIYFVTVSAHERRPLFGEIVDGEMRLNSLGQIVEHEWTKTPSVRPEVALDAFVVLPNHFHAIIAVGCQPIVGLTEGKWFGDMVGEDISPRTNEGARRAPLRKPRSLGSLVAGFKLAVTSKIREGCGDTQRIVWQRNYFEHIIRTDRGLDKIRGYIHGNPANWQLDRENSQRRGHDPFDLWLDSIPNP